jgi:hypothetical protein
LPGTTQKSRIEGVLVISPNLELEKSRHCVEYKRTKKGANVFSAQHEQSTRVIKLEIIHFAHSF